MSDLGEVQCSACRGAALAGACCPWRAARRALLGVRREQGQIKGTARGCRASQPYVSKAGRDLLLLMAQPCRYERCGASSLRRLRLPRLQCEPLLRADSSESALGGRRTASSAWRTTAARLGSGAGAIVAAAAAGSAAGSSSGSTGPDSGAAETIATAAAAAVTDSTAPAPALLLALALALAFGFDPARCCCRGARMVAGANMLTGPAIPNCTSTALAAIPNCTSTLQRRLQYTQSLRSGLEQPAHELSKAGQAMPGDTCLGWMSTCVVGMKWYDESQAAAANHGSHHVPSICSPRASS